MEDQVRLAFRIVLLGQAQDHEAVYQRVLKLISPLGNLYDFTVDPYPKIAGSSMMTIEFDLTTRLEKGIVSILDFIGGTGWHISDFDDAPHAIWASAPGLDRPLSEHLYWAQIQLIPHAQLAESRKPTYRH